MVMRSMNNEDVRKIRLAYANGGLNIEELANALGLAYSTIRSIILGETYKDAGGPIGTRNKGQHHKKYSDDQVREWRRLYDSGINLSKYCKEHGLNYMQVYKIAKRERRKNVED